MHMLCASYYASRQLKSMLVWLAVETLSHAEYSHRVVSPGPLLLVWVQGQQPFTLFIPAQTHLGSGAQVAALGEEMTVLGWENRRYRASIWAVLYLKAFSSPCLFESGVLPLHSPIGGGRVALGGLCQEFQVIVPVESEDKLCFWFKCYIEVCTTNQIMYQNSYIFFLNSVSFGPTTSIQVVPTDRLKFIWITITFLNNPYHWENKIPIQVKSESLSRNRPLRLINWLCHQQGRPLKIQAE